MGSVAASRVTLQTAVDVRTISHGNNQDEQLLRLKGKHHAEITDTQSQERVVIRPTFDLPIGEKIRRQVQQSRRILFRTSGGCFSRNL